MLSNAELKRIALEIKDDTKRNENEKDAYYGKKYPELRENYTRFFWMCCEPGGIDLNHLKILMDMKEKVVENKLTQEKASVQIGQIFYDKYVKPVIGDNPNGNK